MLVRVKMNDNGTIFSGNMQNIFSIGQILIELGFKILNLITWEKLIHRLIFHVNILPIQRNKLFELENMKMFLNILIMT